MSFRVADYQKIKIDEVWAGHPVRFCVMRAGKDYLIGYFNKERQMCIAKYNAIDGSVPKTALPEELGWDSHNRISIGLDKSGFIHVSGNIHKHPLKYFRSIEPGGMAFQRIDKMIGADEDSCTYPMFFSDAQGELFFQYRNGKSGKGDTFINRYDDNTGKWERILGKPLYDGEGQANAYPTEFMLGEDVYFHVAWVWRATPACETNRTLSYAKTKNFINWFGASGKQLETPFRVGGGDVVDDVPINGGILNGSIKIGFDRDKKIVLSYHKFDEAGSTQIFNARFEDGAWKIYKTSQWDYRWALEGGGTIALEITVFPVRWDKTELTQEFKHKKYGEGVWALSADDFSILETRILPDDIRKMEVCANENFVAQFSGDIESPYFLRWESLPANRDKERSVEKGEEASELDLFIKRGEH
jgi:hypothetical protein